MEATMTLRGRVGTDLQTSRSKTGALCVRFRMAVSQWRRTDSGNYEELGVRWYSAQAWGRLAEYVLASVHKGDPVVVVGRPMAHAWTDTTGEIRSDLIINATTIAHDLNFGTTQFFRRGIPAPVISERAHTEIDQATVSVSDQATPEDSEFRLDYMPTGGKDTPTDPANTHASHSTQDADTPQNTGAFSDAYTNGDTEEKTTNCPAA